MNEEKAKKPYVKPNFEVINVNNKLPILCASGQDYGDGGIW